MSQSIGEFMKSKAVPMETPSAKNINWKVIIEGGKSLRVNKTIPRTAKLNIQKFVREKIGFTELNHTMPARIQCGEIQLFPTVQCPEHLVKAAAAQLTVRISQVTIVEQKDGRGTHLLH